MVGMDFDAAAEWLGKQSAELRTDALYGETAEQLRRDGDYGQAAQWAEQIGDEGARSEKLSRIYNSWRANDEESAAKWFDGLDAATRAEVENGEDPTQSAPIEMTPSPADG